MFRLFKIKWIVFRYLLLPQIRKKGRTALARAKALRITLERLGPIFIKFGQVLSTRHDLLSDELVNELSKLQDQVPPFSGEIAKRTIEKSLNGSLSKLFSTVDLNPLASASIAQVHAATLFDGSDVIIKVLRPNVHKIIRRDIRWMHFMARTIKRCVPRSRRLRPVELVEEFKQILSDELDLLCEAANASKLRQNFEHSPMMAVPKIYWEYTRSNVLVMERVYGVRISDIATLKSHQTNFKKLAEYGVEIFFTQVFRDRFFHADMHPGNLFVDIKDPENPRYLGVDFGIMGTLTEEDQQYLAKNLLAFFNRDYRQMAELHVQSGWVAHDTRIDRFETAIRAVCEPIFQKPLQEISFGQLLLQLFRTAEQFDMTIQPQLILLQKTLFNIEGLGRMLYPELDLWATAKPFLERWMREQCGLKKIVQQFAQELLSALGKFVESLR